ncbi:MAG: DUF2017 domain-containing protein [Dermatophilaceae bacterium]
MARAFTRRGRGDDLRYAAQLDSDERGVVVELLRQVRELIAPGGEVPQEPRPTDDFDAIVAGLGKDFGSLTVPDSPEGLTGRGLPHEPRDPALDRLFPSANRTDADAAAEFRRLTESSLRARKVAGLTTAIDVLRGVRGDILELTPAQAQTFVVALTDVRLVIGDRLGLREDADAARLDEVAASLATDDPTAYAIAVYDFLTWLQETLATSMLG